MITETDTDMCEILLGDESANSALNGMDGNDFIFGFAKGESIMGGGNDMITGGGGAETIDYGVGDYTAVFLGNLAISATNSSGAVTLTVMETATTTAGDEGADTLTTIEFVRFADTTLKVVGDHGATARNAEAMMAAEIFVGESATDGTATFRVDGGEGDDNIFLLVGADHFRGGAGNDRIFGTSMDTDSVHYADAMDNYTIWQDATNNIVWYVRDDEAATQGNEGTDVLTSIEEVVFETATTATSAVSFGFLTTDFAGAYPFASIAEFCYDGPGGDEAVAPEYCDDCVCPLEPENCEAVAHRTFSVTTSVSYSGLDSGELDSDRVFGTRPEDEIGRKSHAILTRQHRNHGRGRRTIGEFQEHPMGGCVGHG